jgi:hypothetical protein
MGVDENQIYKTCQVYKRSGRKMLPDYYCDKETTIIILTACDKAFKLIYNMTEQIYFI